MRILLVYPPFYRLIGFYNRYFPLGLVSIGTVLQRAGHEIRVYDADFNESPSAMDYARLPDYYPAYLNSFRDGDNPVWAEVRETIAWERPDVVGISIWTSYAAAAFRVAQISKAVNPSCPVVMGGPHATVKAEEILRISPAVDYVVRGEGEVTIVELVEELARGSGNPGGIKGLSFRDAGGIRHNPPREKIRDLDVLAVADRSLLMSEPTYSSEDMGLIMTSRGCPFSCSFCVTETRQVRYRSIGHILDEIRLVKARYGTTQFSFKDDSFTVNKARVMAFCDALMREGLRIGWECNTRVDLVSEEMLLRMKRAGCNSIKVGVESGSESVLKAMNKGISLDQVSRAAGWLRKAGIHWTGYFLMGTPGESLKDVYKTLDFMYELRPDFASIGVYEPFPGTAMFEEGRKRGLVKPDMTLEDFLAVLPNDYYKADAGRQVETIDREQFEALESELKSRFHAYNRGVGRLLKRARSRAGVYLAQPALLLADFKRYLSWS